MELKSRYHPIELLSSNPASKTFLALDRVAEVPIKLAIKQFKLDNLTQGWEAIAVSKLNIPDYHKYFPQPIDAFVEEGRLYLVDEFIEGVNLKQLLESQGNFNEAQIWRLLNDVLSALNCLHQSGSIHLNIKPTSIIKVGSSHQNLSAGDSTYKLTSPVPAQILAKLGLKIFPSPEYSAPEYLKGNEVAASDLYSLGITCIHLLTGIEPFNFIDINANRWVWSDYLTDKISANLERAIAKLIHNDVSQRFTSVPEVLKAINTDPLAYLVSQPVRNNSQEASRWECIDIDLTKSGFGSINSIAIAPLGNIVAAGRDNKNIELWDLKSKSLLSTLSGHSSAVRSVAFNANGKKLISGSDDKTIRIWDVEKGKVIASLTGHTNSVRSVTYSPCYQFIATGSWDKTVKLWDSHSLSEICTIPAHKLQVNTVAFSPDGKLLASGSCDRTIKIWDISSPSSPELISTLKGHLWAILTVAFHPKKPIIASGSDDNTIKIWDYQTGNLINAINGHSKSVSSLKFLDMEETLISGSWDARLKFWRADSGDEIGSLSSHSEAIYSLAISADNRTIFSTGKDEKIKVWKFLQ